MMTNHTYKWDRGYRLQRTGGPIGDKLACAAARLFMVWFDRKLGDLLVTAGVMPRVYKRYVDDGWFKATCVLQGHRFDPNCQRVVQVMPSSEDTTLPDERTALVFCQIANSVTSMLQWTADWPSANLDKKLPVLDLSVWCQETVNGTVTLYKFYSKPMSNPVSIPANSALSSNIKFSTYRQEIYRVLRNTSVSLPWSQKADLISLMAWRMKLSGYPVGFRLQAISGGIIGHMKLLDRASRGLTDLHRSKETILESKSLKNSVTWYKRGSVHYRSVLFVPATPNSELANSIRNLEKVNRQGRSSRIKVVEKSCFTARNVLAKNYPWDVTVCNDPECFPCITSSGLNRRRISSRRLGVG